MSYIGGKKKILLVSLFFVFLAFFFILSNLKVDEVSAAGIIGSKHDFTSSGAVQGVCQGCHAPHNTLGVRLWARPPRSNPATQGLPVTKDGLIGCLDCHAYDGVPNSIDNPPSLPWLPFGDNVTNGANADQWFWDKTKAQGGFGIPKRLYDGAGNLAYADHLGGTDLNCQDCHKHPKFEPSCCDCHATCIPNECGAAPNYPNAGAGVRTRSFVQEFDAPPADSVPDCAPIINANSHDIHVDSAGLACKECHYDTIIDMDTYHFDHNDVPPPPEVDGIQITADPQLPFFKSTHSLVKYDFTDGKKRCYESCHKVYADDPDINPPVPTEYKQWGGAVSPAGTGCFVCHGGVSEPDVPRPIETADSNPNVIDRFQYENIGHGATVAYAGGNPPAGFTSYLGTLDSPGCYSLSPDDSTPIGGCHFKPADHWPTKDDQPVGVDGDPADPYRLGDTYAEDTNGFCKYCHAPDGTGVAVPAETHAMSTTGSKLDAWSDSWSTNPVKCVDCHDPHGDDADYMVKNEISRQFGSTTFGSPSLGENVANDTFAPTKTPPKVYDPLQMIPVEFSLRAAVPLEYDDRPGRAGDYYNTIAETGLPNGICQVCHVQNIEYNNLETYGGLGIEIKTHSNTFDGNDINVDFLSDAGRRCTDCHRHAYSDNTKGFKTPSIDFADYPLNPNDPGLPDDDPQISRLGPRCADCHLWNPNGEDLILDQKHPLMVDPDIGGLGAGGLLSGVHDSTDENDDIDNYAFGNQPAPVGGDPQIAEYVDRAMIDSFQWSASAHGTPTSQALLDTNAFVPKGGPQFGCAGTTESYDDPILGMITRPAFNGCHDPDVNHGDANNPFRLLTVDVGTGPSTDPVDFCSSCHESLSGPHNHTIAAFGGGGLDPMFEAGKCPDCHDPHGDTAKSNRSTSAALTGILDDLSTTVNAAMIQREVVWQDRWTSNYGDASGKLYPPVRYFVEFGDQRDFAKHDTTMSGICEACHTDTTSGGGEGTRWFRREDADGEVLPDFHEAVQIPNPCVACHSHGPGFACGGCHSFPPANSPFHDEHVTVQDFWCDDCHEGNMTDPIKQGHPDNQDNKTVVINENVDIWFSENFIFNGDTTMLEGETQGPRVESFAWDAPDVAGPFTQSTRRTVFRPKNYIYSHASPVNCRVGCHNPRELYPVRKTPGLRNDPTTYEWDIKHFPNEPDPPLPPSIGCRICHTTHGLMVGLGVWTDDPQFPQGVQFKSAHAVDDADCTVCHDNSQHRGGKVRLVDYNTPTTIYVFDIDDADATSLEPFCLSCHSGNEGAKPFVNTPGLIDACPPDVNKGSGWISSQHKLGGKPRDSYNREMDVTINLTCLGDEMFNPTFPNTGLTIYGCHGNAHGSAKQKLLADAFVPPDYYTPDAKHEPAMDDEEGFCYRCHGEIAGWTEPMISIDGGYITPHKWDDVDVSSITGFSGGSSSCMECHNPHYQSEPQAEHIMWQDRGAQDITSITMCPITFNPLTLTQKLCFDCHDSNAPSLYFNGTSDDPCLTTGDAPTFDLNTVMSADLDFENPASNAVIAHQDLGPAFSQTCTDCHEHRKEFATCKGCHGFPPYDRPDEEKVTDNIMPHYVHVVKYKIMCRSCHYEFDNLLVNPNGHPSATWKAGGAKTPFVNFPTENRSETVPKLLEFLWFPRGTRINLSSTTPASYVQNGGPGMKDVDCNVGCHNPVIELTRRKDSAVSGYLQRQQATYNTVNWKANVIGNQFACTNCHDKIKERFGQGAATIVSKHPVVTERTDCEECHGMTIYPMEEIDIGASQNFYHTQYRVTRYNPITWPTDSYIPLYYRDEANTYFLEVTTNEDTLDVSYSIDDDETDEDIIEPFCLSCHNSDYYDCNLDNFDRIFSGNYLAPNIRRWYLWENSAHNNSMEITISGYTGLSCFGEPDLSYVGTGLVGCHGNPHGVEKAKLLGPAYEAPGSCNENSEEAFCYKCHNQTSRASYGLINYSLSGAKHKTGMYPPGFFSYDDIEQAFNYGSHHPVNDCQQPGNCAGTGTAVIECTSCHLVHWASGKWTDTPNGKSPISRIGQVEYLSTCAGNDELDVLWGDDPGEKAKDYAARYGSSGGAEHTLYDPDGFCCGGSSKPAEYFLPKAWWTESDQIPDTATFCLDCHDGTDTTRTRCRTIVGPNCDWSYERCNPWPSDAHGGSSSNLPYAGGNSNKWWTPDVSDPYYPGCDRDAGVSAHFIRNNSRDYVRQAQRDRVVGINFVLVCTDCHDPHGSPIGYLFRGETNNRINDSGVLNLSSSGGGGNWNTTCNQCHWYYGAQHAGMSCGNASCHERNSIHSGKKLSENYNSGTAKYIVFDETPCAYPPEVNIPEGLVLHWSFNEGSGTTVNNEADVQNLSNCTSCGTFLVREYDGHLTKSVLPGAAGMTDLYAWKTAAECGNGTGPCLEFTPNQTNAAAAQLDFTVDPNDGYPEKFGIITGLQADNFMISFYANPTAVAAEDRLVRYKLNNKLRRDPVSTEFWIKNWSVHFIRYTDANPLGGTPTTEGANYDVIKFKVAVGDPNDMVFDYWCNTWPQTVFPVDPANQYTGARWIYDPNDCSINTNTKRYAAFSYALTKTKKAVLAGEVPAVPYLDVDRLDPYRVTDPSIADPLTNYTDQGTWQLIQCTFDGRYLKIYIDGVEAASTDMGGTGDYVVVDDPLYWGGTGVNRHVASPFAVGARPQWSTGDTDANGISQGGDYWNAYADYRLNSNNFKYVGLIDEVKYYNTPPPIGPPPPEVTCSCHTDQGYPDMRGAHKTHFDALYGPKDWLSATDEQNCDTCHGQGTTQGTLRTNGVIGNLPAGSLCNNGILNFADAEDLGTYWTIDWVYDDDVARGHSAYNDTAHADPFWADAAPATPDPSIGTRVCDKCHGIYTDYNTDPTKADNQGWRLQIRSNWFNDRSVFMNDVGETEYCGSCHGETNTQGMEAEALSVVNTDLGTAGMDVEATDEVAYLGAGHSGAAINVACNALPCHDADIDHIDGSPGNMSRMQLDPLDPPNRYNPEVNDQACTWACHDGSGGPGKAVGPPVSTHANSYNPPGKPYIKQEQDFPGLSGNGSEGIEIRCVRCHNIHGTSNLSQIRDVDFDSPDGGTRTVIYTATTGAGSFDADDSATIPEGAAGVFGNPTDLCVVCHIYESPLGSGIYTTNMSSHPGGFHRFGLGEDQSHGMEWGYMNIDLRGTDCTKCHLHNYDGLYNTKDGFMVDMGPDSGNLCLDCHTTGGLSQYNTDVQFDEIGNDFDNGILSQHLINYDKVNYAGKQDVECIKCHGSNHPTPDKRVVGADTGIGYSSSTFRGRIPDNLNDFCFSCHDGDAATTIITDIQFGEVGTAGTPGALPLDHLQPRDGAAIGPWNPNPNDPDPLTGLPTPAQRYMTLFFQSGHGSIDPLDPATRMIGPKNKCVDCHDYHGNMNYRLIKDLPGSYDGSVTYAYDGENYNTFDDWCTFTCHAMATPKVHDHTGPGKFDTESGDSRDATTESPSEAPSHATSTFSPQDNLPVGTPDIAFVKTIAQMQASPYVGAYLSPSTLTYPNEVLCVTCHDPHGSNPEDETDAQMMRAEFSNPEPLYIDPTEVDICRECHQ